MKRSRSIVVLASAPVVAAWPATAQQLDTLRAVLIPTDGVKAIYYGMRQGIFRKYGLDLQVTVAATGSAAAAALIGGTADVGFTNIVALINANRKGVPLQIVAPAGLLASERPYVGIYVLKDSPIRSGRELNGKTIGSPAIGDLLWAGTLAWVDGGGGDSKSVHMIEVGLSAAVPMLEQGRADAVTMLEPYGSQAVESGKVRVLGRPMDAIAKQFEGGAFAAMEPVIVKNPEAMARFARAVHEAAAYTNAHEAETVDLVASYTRATPETVAKMARSVDPEYAEARNLQPVIDVLARYGVLDKAFPAQELISSVALRPPRGR